MESIARLMAELPKDYEQECFETGALTRLRGVASPADLMMLVMFHLQNGCSLLEISVVAHITKLGEMSDVAFMNRFEKCGNWFIALNEKIASGGIIDYRRPTWLEDKIVIGVDATDVMEKGRSRRMYRLHYALDIFRMRSVQQSITSGKEGESLLNFTLTPDHLVIADRMYSTIRGIEHCEKSGAQYILRLRTNSFTVRDKDGEKIELLPILSQLKAGAYADLSAYVTGSDGAVHPIRICAKRKTPEAIAQTKKKLLRKESKNQCKISDEAKTFNEYIVTVTNVDPYVTAEEILEAYRLRWQVEIYFKRLKSILGFGELPKRRPASAIAWLNGKLMIALLIEIMLAKASFPPQENAGEKRMAGNKVPEPMAHDWVL